MARTKSLASPAGRTRSRSTRGRKPKKPEYEFLGPPGAAVIVIGLPIVCYVFAFACNDISGCPAPSLLHPKSFNLEKLKSEVAWPGFAGLLNYEAFGITLAYYALSFILWAVVPATEAEGTQLASGGRLKYRFNAFGSALVTLAMAVAASLCYHPWTTPWEWTWDNYVPLLTSNIIIATFLSIFVYVRSFEVGAGSNAEHRELARGGVTGNLLYDFFIGRELNPPINIPFIGTVEIKSFMEVRPGMLGWIILNLTSAVKQYVNYGRITDSMIMVVFTQSLYYFDAIYNEPAIMTQMDITTDGFGFMLAFGDLVWLPFTYSLQARYLAVYPVDLGVAGTAGCIAVLGVGYYIFRSANNEKDRFRKDPNHPANAHLESITTKTGSKLLVTGWWGRARHINYLGDWIMSLSYVLPTGLAGYIIQPSTPFTFRTPKDAAFIKDDFALRGGYEVVPGEAKGWGMIITYFFMAYFAVLLIHRQRRDDEKCHRKYGKDWEKYCERVPSRIVPGIY